MAEVAMEPGICGDFARAVRSTLTASSLRPASMSRADRFRALSASSGAFAIASR